MLRQRAIPEGLTPQEAKILSKVRHRAHRLDHGMSICGLKFGFAAMIGTYPSHSSTTPLRRG